MADPKTNDAPKVIAAVLGLVASLLVAAWLLGFLENGDSLSDDPEVAELQRDVQQYRDQENPPEPTDAARDAFRQRMERLTPEQREEFFVSLMPMMMPMMERRLNEFFALPEEEQLAQIDREIDAMESMRRQGLGGRGPFGGGGAQNVDPKRMQSMMKRMSAHTTPELRSMFDQRTRMMNDRRAERGLEPIEFGG